MLRVLLIFCALCVLINTSSGQFAVGGKAGYNFNSFRGKNVYEAVPGFNAGVYVKHPILPFLTLRGEALYAMQGAKFYSYPVLGSELIHTNSRAAFHNIQIPVLAEFGLPSLAEDNLQPKLLLGGFYSYTFYARENYTNVAGVSGVGSMKYKGFSDLTQSINRSQYGLIAGIATELKLFSRPVSIEVRYQYNIDKVNHDGTQNLYNWKLAHAKWGNDLHLSTLSINLGMTLYYF